MKIVRAARAVCVRSLLLLIGVLALANGSLAQTPQQTAIARSLFEEGVTLADRGDWQGAADRFGRAYSLKPTAGIAFNWAKAQQENGQLLHAQELLRSVVRDPAADPALKRESEASLRALEARTAKLRITTSWKPRDDNTIEVDGALWPRAAWGYASPIDPGKHVIVCKEDDDVVARAEITLRQGETRSLTLKTRDEIERDDASASATKPAGQHSERNYKTWLVWSAVGAVVVGGAIAVAVLTRPDGDEAGAPVMGNATPGVIRW